MGQYAYFQKVFEKPKRGGGKRKNQREDMKNIDDSDMSDEEGDEVIPESKRRKNADAFDFSSRNETDTIVLSPKPVEETDETEIEKIPVEDAGRIENFQNQLSVIFDAERAQQMTTELIITGMQVHDFSAGEVMWCLEKMMEDNKVFIADDIV